MRLTPALFPFLLLASCTDAHPPGSPDDTVARFLQAVAAGDDHGARSLLAPAERDLPGIAFQKEGLARGCTVGAARVDGDRAVVPVTFDGIGRPLPQVCVRLDGTWFLSIRETMRENTGFDPAQLGRAMHDGLQQLGSRMQKRVQDTAERTLHAAPR